MKKLVAALVLLSSLAFVACGDKGGGGGSSSDSQFAATPQPCNNQGQPGALQNCQAYQNYYGQQSFNWNYGAWYWPSQYTQSYGSCGCNGGFQPVQGPFGMACAPSAYFSSYRVVYSYGYAGFPYWQYGQNTGWTNMPQQYYQPAGGACSPAQGCDVRLNNCSGGARCQPIAGGSTIGLCIR